jgi:hypothetical protein
MGGTPKHQDDKPEKVTKAREGKMSQTRKIILGTLVGILVLDAVMTGLGAYWGHNGMFEFGAEVGKYIFSTVVGALVTAFADAG